LLKQGKHKSISALVTPALELNPSHVLLYLYRGKARMALADYEGAVEDFRSVIRINPFDPEVHALLARGFAQLGRDDDAEFERKQHRLLSGS
jgi:Flp pilus assembly protein TadD